MSEHALSTCQGNRVLVTGGAGFIGSHLVETLVAEGTCVTVVDNFATGHLDNLRAVQAEVEVIVGDLGDVLRLRRITLGDYNCVFHLAANPYIPPSVENPAFDYHENLENTFALLETLRQIDERPRLINTSSAAVYGNPVRLPIRETDPTVPISPYGVSKLAGERYVAVYSQLYGLWATSLRLFSVYGPRQRKQVVFDLLQKLRADPARLEILGDGSQERDFTYVQDVVQAMMVAAVNAPGQGEVFNVASGQAHSINELVTILGEVCGITPERAYTGQVRPGDADKWAVDITPLGRLGFQARTSLRAGLITVKDWYDATL
jgi:UDP-glucose 4-epimerase